MSLSVAYVTNDIYFFVTICQLERAFFVHQTLSHHEKLGEETHGDGAPKARNKEDREEEQVTGYLLKRRAGFFNKVAQSSAMCGTVVVVFVMSPAKKVYAFGNLSTDSVIDRFFSGNSYPTRSSPLQDSRHVLHSSMKYLEAVGKLETEKKQEKVVEESKAAAGCGFWWDEPIDGLGLDELEQYMASLEVVKKKVRTRAEEIAMTSASSSNFLPPGGVAM
ncbi:hypothetical protein F0562_013775 [Nyssa sinensis]|uniref:MADS-box domain-containing protein n=1 Tax=Nyssa sinensis TaxID=561372 RepID=A0A5J4ZNH5_9ASTE|nr:hypothetical protein F0562_013775 [Nyssa sinensis]